MRAGETENRATDEQHKPPNKQPQTAPVLRGTSAALCQLPMRGLQTPEQEEELKVPGMEADSKHPTHLRVKPTCAIYKLPLPTVTHLPKARFPHS